MLKKIILWTITVAMALLLFWGISCFDSDMIAIPLTAMAIGGAWLFVFFKTNDWFLEVGEK